MKSLRTTLAALALCFGFAASANATDYISHRLGDLMPYTGTYIDWSVGGVSMEFDFGPNATAYGSFFLFHTYDEAGNQINWIGQPDVVPTTEEDRLATGVIARASGGLYYAKDGPCIGCAPRPATIIQTGVNFDLAWSNARNVTLTLSGAKTGVFHLVAANYASRNDDVFLPGTWSATVVYDAAAAAPTDPKYNYMAAALAIVKISPLPTSVHFALDPGAPAGSILPPATAQLFALSCPNDSKGQGGACRSFLAYMTDGFAKDVVVWFDPVSKQAGIESATGQGGAEVIGTDQDALHVDLSITPQVIRGHGTDRFHTDKYTTFAVTLVRVPDATVRDSADYPHVN